VELRGAAQRLTRPGAATALLGVMDDQHGNVMPALQFAQVGEQRSRPGTREGLGPCRSAADQADYNTD
jgi:hypothetical protein